MEQEQLIKSAQENLEEYVKKDYELEYPLTKWEARALLTKLEQLSRIEQAARHVREYILARTYKVRLNRAEEFVTDVRYILGDAEPTAMAGIPVLKKELGETKD